MACGWDWLVAAVVNYCLHSAPTVGPESGVGLPFPARTHTVNQAGLTVDARCELACHLLVGAYLVLVESRARKTMVGVGSE
jgi:hypothetical protein